MNFTKTKPTLAGYYWNRRYRYKALVLYRVWGTDTKMLCRRIDLDTLCEKETLDEVGGEWYGPVEIPYPADDTAPAV